MRKLHKHSIDELFADNLSDFSADPPEIVWNKLSGKLPIAQGAVPKYYRLARYSAAASIAILISVFSYAWYNGIIFHTNKPLTAMGVDHNKFSGKKLVQAPLFSGNDENNNESKSIINNNHSGNIVEVTVEQNSENAEPVQNNEIQSNPEVSHNLVLPQKEFIRPMGFFKRMAFSQAEPRVLPDFSFKKSDDYYNYPYFFLGTGGGIELLQSDNQRLFSSNKSNSFFSLNGGIQFTNFYIETGLQLNKISGTFQGIKNSDLVYHNGEITNIDSVGYAIVFDSLNQPYYIPVYYTSTSPNYDTMTVQAPAQIRKTLTYLEIPFNIGVSQTFKRHYVAASMGMSYSFKISDQPYDSFNSEALLLKDIPSFWSLKVNMSYQYMITNHWNAGLKIQYRYFSKTGTNTNQFLNSSYSLGISPTITYIF